MRVIWLPNAISSRDNQIRYIAKDRPMAALDQLDIVLNRIDLLEQFPRSAEHISKTDSYRLVITGTSFVALYRIRNSRIEIFRFLHGKQNPL